MWDLHFHKYQGTGNDFIIVNDREGTIAPALNTETIRFLCDRRFGIGADGLMLLSSHPTLDFRMIYFNSDGRESSMCGNGGRCLVHFAHAVGAIGHTADFEAIDGLHEAILEGDTVRLKMGIPTGYRQEKKHRDWLDTGSPHVVEWLEKSPETVNVVDAGAAIRYAEPYAPGGTNVNFVQAIEDDLLSVRTYERGVEDETYSCGTGVTACAYAHLIRQHLSDGRIGIQTPGGHLSVEIKNRGQQDEEVWLCGPATFVYSGNIGIRDN